MERNVELAVLAPTTRSSS